MVEASPHAFIGMIQYDHLKSSLGGTNFFAEHCKNFANSGNVFVSPFWSSLILIASFRTAFWEIHLARLVKNKEPWHRVIDVNQEELLENLFERVRLTATAFYAASGEHASVVAEFSGMLDHPDTNWAVHRAARLEREAIQEYRLALKALSDFLTRDG